MSSSSRAPPSAGREDARPRCFTSRHVPSVAEEIVHSEVLHSGGVEKRFLGLMKYLKNNAAWEGYQKVVLLADRAETLVPEQYDEALRNEFARRCAFGDRMNLEFMSSAKWVKLLRDVKAIGVARDRAGRMTLAEADIAFHKVLHHCEHGGQRLTYELFCKALYLVAQAIKPHLQGTLAFSEFVSEILEFSAEETQRAATERWELMLDADVVSVLDYFRPALDDMFHALCGRNLSNLTAAGRGLGGMRIRERAVWKHTQETTQSLRAFCENLTNSVPDTAPQSQGAPLSSSPTGLDFHALPPGKRDFDSTASLGISFDPRGKEAPVPLKASACGGCSATCLGPKARGAGAVVATGGSAGAGASPVGISAVSTTGSAAGTGSTSAAGSAAGPVATPRSSQGWLGSPGCSAAASTRGGGPRLSGVAEDPYVYAGGAPVLHDRQRYMSGDQLLSWCSAFNVVPELLSRLEVVRIFRQAQCAGSRGPSSVHGYLSRDAFVDAVGQMAVVAYSKEPFCDEFPKTHEKIFAFLLSALPRNSREAHDRFLYGCAGRGR